MTQDKHTQLKTTILDEVTSGDVHQKSSLYFVLHRLLLWGIAIGVTILGTISFAILFAALYDLRGTVFILERTEVGEVLVLVPYLWIAGGGVLTWYAYRRVRQTEHGYRYPIWLVASVLMVCSVLGGGVLYTAGFAQRADHFLAERVPGYAQVGNPQHRLWRSPEQGIFAGRIIQVDEHSVTVQDIRGRNWQLQRDTVPDAEVGTLVRVIGVRAATSSIDARAILKSRPSLPPREELELLREQRKRMLRHIVDEE